MQCCCYSSPLGEMILAAEGGAVIGLWFHGQRYERAGLDENAPETDESAVLSAACLWLDAYFAGKRPAITSVPLDARGSDFQKLVWEKLIQIPYGETTTYGAIAKSISPEMSAQAVGGAVGHNPVSIIIPCHRVVGADGSLTGYAGGVEIKRKLLMFEKSCY